MYTYSFIQVKNLHVVPVLVHKKTNITHLTGALQILDSWQFFGVIRSPIPKIRPIPCHTGLTRQPACPLFPLRAYMGLRITADRGLSLTPGAPIDPPATPPSTPTPDVVSEDFLLTTPLFVMDGVGGVPTPRPPASPICESGGGKRISFLYFLLHRTDIPAHKSGNIRELSSTASLRGIFRLERQSHGLVGREG